MSHKLFRHSTFRRARVWAFRRRVDTAEAETCRPARRPRHGMTLSLQLFAARCAGAG